MAKAGSGALHASRSRSLNSYLALSNEMHQTGRQRKSTRRFKGLRVQVRRTHKSSLASCLREARWLAGGGHKSAHIPPSSREGDRIGGRDHFCWGAKLTANTVHGRGGTKLLTSMLRQGRRRNAAPGQASMCGNMGLQGQTFCDEGLEELCSEAAQKFSHRW